MWMLYLWRSSQYPFLQKLRMQYKILSMFDKICAMLSKCDIVKLTAKILCDILKRRRSFLCKWFLAWFVPFVGTVFNICLVIRDGRGIYFNVCSTHAWSPSALGTPSLERREGWRRTSMWRSDACCLPWTRYSSRDWKVRGEAVCGAPVPVVLGEPASVMASVFNIRSVCVSGGY